MAAKANSQLKEVFTAFASFGSSASSVEMEGKNWAKFCKDTKLMSKVLTSTDVDLIFAKVKAKGARKISYDAFVRALEAVAAKKGVPLDEVVATATQGGGPENSGTQAEAVKWHDDKSTYTGVYAKGGPTNMDMDPTNLAGLCDRSAADARGVKLGSNPGSRRATGEVASTKAAVGRRTTAESSTALAGSLKNNLKL